MDQAAIKQIIEQYEKHGWKLRRVLLSDSLRAGCGEPSDLFGDADVTASQLDAAWFSRSSKPDVTAWELRRLTGTPYAIVTGIREGVQSDEVEAALRETEAKMLGASLPAK